MKKLVCILITIIIILSVTAFAESVSANNAVPSKTTTDNTMIKQPESATGVKVDETFAIVVREDAQPVIEEINSLFNHVVAEKKAPVAYFPEETKEKIEETLIVQLLKAEGVEVPIDDATGSAVVDTAAVAPEILEKLPDLEEMEINEFISIEPVEYKEEYGDIKSSFAFVTQYQPEQKVVMLFGLYTGEVDETGAFVVDWIVLEAAVEEDGFLSVIIPQAEMLKMQEAENVAIAVLSEKTELTGAE